jgi:predicted Zn-dependent protease
MADAGMTGVLDLISSGDTLEALSQLYALGESDPLARLNRVLYTPDHANAEALLSEERERLLGVLSRSEGHPRAVVLYNLGCLALAEDEVVEARLYFRQALEQWPEYLPARHNLAHTSDLLAEEDEAEVLYDQVLGARPEMALSRLNLALIDLELGRRDKGMEGLRQLVAEQPRNPSLVLYLCRAILATGNPSDAAEVPDLLAGLGDWQRYPDLRECHAYASYLLNELAEAETAFRGLLDEDPNNQFARVGLMRILAGQEAWSDVASHAEALHAAAPTEQSANLVQRLTEAGMISE